MHAMWKPQKFKAIHLMATLYVLTLTLPLAVAVYWAFDDMLLNHSNAFAPKAVKENRNLNHNLQPPSSDPSSINLSTSSPKMTFRNSPAKTAADSSKIKGCAGLPGTNLRRSSKLFLSKHFLNLPTMVLLHRFPPPYTTIVHLASPSIRPSPLIGPPMSSSVSDEDATSTTAYDICLQPLIGNHL